MSKTKNIGLNLTTDNSTSFADWQKSIDGENVAAEKSNMQIIDDAFGEVPLYCNTTFGVNYTAAEWLELYKNSTEFDFLKKVNLNRVPRVNDAFDLIIETLNDNSIILVKGYITAVDIPESGGSTIKWKHSVPPLVIEDAATLSNHESRITTLEKPTFRDVVNVGAAGSIALTRDVTSILLFTCTGLEVDAETGVAVRGVQSSMTFKVVPKGLSITIGDITITVGDGVITYTGNTSSYIRIVFAEVY